MSAHVVVVHEPGDRTLSAVRHGISLLRSTPDSRLTVIHTAKAGVTVRNGPTAAMAERLGRPGWALVYTRVMAAGADPDRTEVIVASTPTETLIHRHAPDATRIVLSASGRRPLFGRDPAVQLAEAFGCPVVRAPLTPPSADSTRSPAPALSPMRRAAA